jgi:MFS family permease
VKHSVSPAAANAHTVAVPTPAAAAQKPSLWRAEVLVLFGIALVHNLDRTLMSGLLQPIKQEFALNDAATGALSGAAFGLAYVTLGLPFARLADVANRRLILALSVGLWGALTLACGFTAGFWTFFAARLGVGIFEAAGAPAMYALCADRFGRLRGSTAAATLVVGATLGAMIGITGGGAIADWAGWRASFWLGGLPGLALAPLAFVMLVEPRTTVPFRLATVLGAGLRAEYAWLLAKPAFRCMLLGSMTWALWYWGTATWFITYLVRAHSMSLAEATFGYGILTGISTLLGVLLNGFIGDRLARRDERWLGWLPAVAMMICLMLAVPTYFVTSGTWALLLYMICSVFMGVVTPGQYALTYALTGSRARAAGVAALNFCNYLVGLAVAGAAVGALSDALTPSHGPGSLGMSLLLVTGVLPVAAGLYLASTKFFARDIERDRAPDEPSVAR